jgi:glycosyltransferase involved in cell wall biosynthesis
LPRISIVVPNYNGGSTLARALESLFEQRYPDLEVFVVDGGSNDGSQSVIEQYSDRLAGWVSGPDRGQADALNQGFSRTNGEIVGWLCSDDQLLPGALATVGVCFATHPAVDVYAGAAEVVFERRRERNYVQRPCSDALAILPFHNSIAQQATFWRRRVMRRRPPLDVEFCYALDQEWWCWLAAQGVCWRFSDATLGRFILSGDNKTATGGGRVADELEKIYCRYSNDRIPLALWYRKFRYPLERLFRRDRGRLRRGILAIFQLAWMIVLAPFYGWRRVRLMSWPV